MGWGAPHRLAHGRPRAAHRRLDALPLAAGVAQIAAMAAVELRALARHLRTRLVPSEAPPAAAVAERRGRLAAEA